MVTKTPSSPPPLDPRLYNNNEHIPDRIHVQATNAGGQKMTYFYILTGTFHSLIEVLDLVYGIVTNDHILVIYDQKVPYHVVSLFMCSSHSQNVTNFIVLIPYFRSCLADLK